MHHMSSRLRCWCAVVLSLFGIGAAPQSDFTQTIQVEVTSVDVVVTRRDGTPITGLTREDFTLLENGVEQPLSNFLEMHSGVARTEASAIEAPAKQTPSPEAQILPVRRHVIFYVDQSTITPRGRKRLEESVAKFVGSLSADDRMMVVAANNAPDVRLPFSSDKSAVLQHLREALRQGTGGLGRASSLSLTRMAMRDLMTKSRSSQSIEQVYSHARVYAAGELSTVRRSSAALNTLLASVSGIEGRKALVLVSEGFPMEPGREAFIFADELTSQRRAHMEVLSYRSDSFVRALADTANRSRVTIDPLHAAGLDLGIDLTETTDVSVGQSGGFPTDRWGSFQYLATQTGGVVSVNTNNFDRAITTMKRDLDAYYSLGYSSATLDGKTRRERKIEVKVRTPGATVRFRRSFIHRSNEDRAQDLVLASLIGENPPNDLNIRVTLESAVGKARKRRVPVAVEIPMTSLTLLPEGEAHAGGFTLLVAGQDAKERFSDVMKRAVVVRVPDRDMAALNGKHFTYAVELEMTVGRHELAFAVVDRHSGIAGFARKEVDIPR